MTYRMRSKACLVVVGVVGLAVVGVGQLAVREAGPCVAGRGPPVQLGSHGLVVPGS